MPTCTMCQYSYHGLCKKARREKTHLICCCSEKETESPIITVVKSTAARIRKKKDRALLRDPLSTGRKEAAALYPIEAGVTRCEWASLAKAGGGIKPIVGCMGNFASDRHHGPDKNTTSNQKGNVHRICSFCHNRWHADNDEFYDDTTRLVREGLECLAHDNVTQADIGELILAASKRKNSNGRAVSE